MASVWAGPLQGKQDCEIIWLDCAFSENISAKLVSEGSTERERLQHYSLDVKVGRNQVEAASHDPPTFISPHYIEARA